ncbi:hypothetical protein F511_07971 [Dorcoceras hygrometricum]|uniref:Uncharacterized protein n=1 Tax=Dorcoceras hygrometricum TaxID=472368 RepID=A0A2Z7BXA9_9LAMI|nr:hypothetical protein F511_07971 [Dorcoceras hygrometricum]
MVQVRQLESGQRVKLESAAGCEKGYTHFFNAQCERQLHLFNVSVQRVQWKYFIRFTQLNNLALSSHM